MLNQYTWGDFALFVVVVVTLYYLVVGFLYYRQELTAFLTRKGRGGAQLAGVGAAPAASAPPSLVRTQSAFVVATPTAMESKADVETPDAEAGAASNLSDGQEVPEVTGSLPDSTAAATGLDDGESAAVPMDSAGGGESEADTAAEYDEQRTEELDEVDTELAARARQLATQMPVEQTDESSATVIEKNNNETGDIETISAFSHVDAHAAYEQGPATGGDLLYEFEQPIGSTADILPAAEQLFSAISVVDFIAQARAGNRPAGPVALKETSLASLVADKVSASNQELNDLFGDDDS